MCGIAGFLNYDEHRSLAEKSNLIQSHRGPDSNGVWSSDNLSFAHQRLSIIDLDPRSDQPFIKDGLVIVYNGEVYNYAEKRKFLQDSCGVEFTTTSDTEVILELYRFYGEKCLDHLIGMFAFAIYNPATGNTFIARDHFGIKPLFYVQQGKKFAFSSELKTLRKLVAKDNSVNFTALAACIQLQWLPDHYCIFEGVSRLQPGHYLLVDSNGQVQCHEYWKLSEQPTPDIANLSLQDTIDYLSTELENTISRHLVSDVEVGSFLSGGLDSSLVSTIAGRKTGSISTFTIGMRQEDKKIEKMADDQFYAELIAKKEGFNHKSIVVEPNVVDELPKLAYSLDEPIGDPAAINTALICELANASGLKVLLSGMGADELFFGYRRHKALLYAQRYQKLPAILRNAIGRSVNVMPVRIGNSGFRLGRWAKKFNSFANLPISQGFQRSYSQYEDDELLGLVKVLDGDHLRSFADYHETVMRSLFIDDPINNFCQTDIKLYMSGLNLTYTDRATMAKSIEARVPFIDKLFVEAAMSINSRFKFQKGESKYILKKVAEKYLPKEVIYRPKSNFSLPIRSWLATDLNEMVMDLLSAERVKKRGWYNPDAISKLISDHVNGTRDNSAKIYQLLSIELWAESLL
ncbi:asparagine synthase (glutamine-hydrolyzing) [Sneathiella sp. P13V-1]|uniref:asparagine synthase (glutamine-hydrolyzing) n=1 Tax=Sneathiella sp. P13V-1 TaxID=2697366 RepID=UPI00187B89E3|nr:asparagine synthase (glutamine-hydrolyzing) [Sneathiella sp. P13V-1]MBE7636400.1 asparagine synthase (glutamine-hydrolyzing) [Sneathiella sp. P13V-1]